MPAIRTEKLTKIYRRSHLGKVHTTVGIENVDLEIKKGEIFGLLGLNGSGKTTTIKLILGLLRPTKGGVFLLGEPAPSIKALKQVGFLPETPYFYRYLTALEILKFYGELSGVERVKDKAAQILDFVGLAEVGNKRLGEFSKGMLQRIGIAQSLIHDPGILIYDEPVSGLDPLAMSEMRNLIMKLKSEGKTIFLSSHMISEVEKVCDRVGILVKGELVKVLDQSEWNKSQGKLEAVFVDTVKDTAEFGRIKI
ncbi:MAG: ABC transporter ATP-binding protein [Elusimicrobiota bacterium]